jgi:hypothetical protein
LRLLFVVLLFALASSQVARADSFSIGEFASYQAADWGDDTTAINLLENDFSVVYSSVGGVLIVGETTNFELVFSGSTALLNYLPSTGAPGPLDSTYVDPLTTSSGIFGGDVVAMALSVDFSAAGALAHPAGIPFGDLYLTGFDAPDTVRNLPALPGLDGMTASQLLTLDDTALGGGSTGGYSIADLAVITNFVSTAFDPDDNFLGFADAHLTTTNPNAGSGGNPTPTPEPSSLLLLASGLLALGMFRYWRRGWVLFFIVLFLSLASSRADRADTFSTGEFVSYGQAEWPSDPAAIYLIEANFSAMYGTFQIGGSGEGSGSYALYFSNPTALLTYLDTAVRLKVEENQLVDVFGEIGFHVDGLKGA